MTQTSAIQTTPPQSSDSPAPSPSPLTETEQARRTALEAQVDNGLEAMFKIKTEGLWHDYDSFASYLDARWHKGTPRRANQLVAGYRVMLILKDALEGTTVPVSESEFALRPLVTLAAQDPHKAVEVYQKAVELSGGAAPGNAQVVLARQMITDPDTIERQRALAQLRGMERYHYLEHELLSGGKPSIVLALATALESCAHEVRRVLLHNDVRDLALIRLVNEGYKNKREMAFEILRTNAIQVGARVVPLSQATAADYRELADLRMHEHILETLDAKRGEPVSIVAYYGDPSGTLQSLKQVLSYSMLIQLGNMIGEL